MKTIHIHLQSLPIGTPPGAQFYLAGNFNAWQPGDHSFHFMPNGDGSYHLSFQTELPELEYKITRGNWKAAEGNEIGKERPNRVFRPGASEADLWVQVESWTDLRTSVKNDNILLIHPEFEMPQLGRRRRIWACLPRDYWTRPEQRFPVIYMHDGQNLFDNPEAVFGSWGIDKAMNRFFLHQNQGSGALANEVQPILIGIENGGGHRLDEYAPWRHPMHGGGQGELYLDFICESLKPFVDEHFRTLPEREHTGIMGSSMGGLISLYAALEKPDVFGMAGVFSPSIWFSKKELFQLAQMHRPAYPVKILLMAGQQESGDMVEDLLDLYETLLDAGHDEHHLHYDLHSDGVHSEWFWGREFEHALRWLLGDMPGHAHGGISNELIRFTVDKKEKELHLQWSPGIRKPLLEIRDYCHHREFRHHLSETAQTIPYAAWENCIYSIRLISEGDLVFSRRVHLD